MPVLRIIEVGYAYRITQTGLHYAHAFNAEERLTTQTPKVF